MDIKPFLKIKKYKYFLLPLLLALSVSSVSTAASQTAVQDSLKEALDNCSGANITHARTAWVEADGSDPSKFETIAFLKQNNDYLSDLQKIKSKCASSKSHESINETVRGWSADLGAANHMAEILSLAKANNFKDAIDLAKKNKVELTELYPTFYPQLLGKLNAAVKNKNTSSPVEQPLSYAQLDRQIHVGMKVGKKYWVTARHKTVGPLDVIKPVEERNSSGEMVIDHMEVKTEMLSEEQRGALYDLKANAGCFEIAKMSDGSLELTSVKPGSCK